MNNINKLVLAFCVLFFATGTQAQSKMNPSHIKLGVGVHDSYGTYKSDRFPLGLWNTENLDKGAQMSYSRYVNEFIDYGVNLTAVKVEEMRDANFTNTSKHLMKGSSIDLDLVAKYKFYNGVDFKENARIQPYIYTGISPTYVSELPSVSSFKNGVSFDIPVGFGTKIRVTDQVNLEYNGALKVGLFNKIPNRWEHMAGLGYSFGTPKVDNVKEEAAVPIPQPKDTDMDGVIDVEDDCPEVKGLKELRGCPKEEIQIEEPAIEETDEEEVVIEEVIEVLDTDRDGIADDYDKCPNEAGIKELDGCPKPVDTDGDGIADKDDACPSVAGIKELNGCPKPKVVDTDGDGINDDLDRCPNVAGVPSLAGCPQKEVSTDSVSQADKVKIQEISKNIFFETASTNLKPVSKAKLDELHSIIKGYSDFTLSIEGHTDSSGAADLNQRLSEKRAAAVRNYLVSKGLPSHRITSIGYGENRPIADNNTAEGKRMNRRVELKFKARK